MVMWDNHIEGEPCGCYGCRIEQDRYDAYVQQQRDEEYAELERQYETDMLQAEQEAQAEIWAEYVYQTMPYSAPSGEEFL